MRSILALFAVAALGFVVILHKKDAPEPMALQPQQPQPSAHAKVRQHNWTKQSLDTTRAVAKNVQRQRPENEVP